jgi:5'-nucleotidase
MQKITRRLFLDLDGVLANFDSHFLDEFGMTSGSTPDDRLWAYINAHGSFFYDLPVYDGTREFMDKLIFMGHWPIILTACPKSNYHHVARQKKAWVRDKLGYLGMVLPVMGGANKGMFLQDKGDFLIDDMERNCKAWEAEGGRAILHTDLSDSYKKLWDILNEH